MQPLLALCVAPQDGLVGAENAPLLEVSRGESQRTVAASMVTGEQENRRSPTKSVHTEVLGMSIEDRDAATSLFIVRRLEEVERNQDSCGETLPETAPQVFEDLPVCREALSEAALQVLESLPTLGEGSDVEGPLGALVSLLRPTLGLVTADPVTSQICSSFAQVTLEAVTVCYGIAPGPMDSDVPSTSQQPTMLELELQLEAALKENATLREQNC